MTKLKWIVALLVVLIILSCNRKEKDLYLEQVEAWQDQRVNLLKLDYGWLTLAGLYWLDEGENTFGSDRTNDIIFPEGKAEDFIGSFYLNNDTIRMKINPGVEVLCDSIPVQDTLLKSDVQGYATLVTAGPLSWHIIKRGNKNAVRLKDKESHVLKDFEGIDRYTIDPEWKIEAKLIPYDTIRKIPLPTAYGTIDTVNTPGELVFKIKGKEYILEAIGDKRGYNLFVIFGDETNGVETYGGGRFLYTEQPDSTGKVIIDFNKAYNPPCAFTEYATCPLPPDQNKLAVEIKAGEKAYGSPVH